MEEKKPFTQRMEAFFAGKGFYIVLALCLAVIGVSAWSMLSVSKAPGVEDLSMPVSNLEENTIAANAPVRPSAAPTPAAAPKAAQTPTPAPETTLPEPTPAPVIVIPVDPAPAQAQSYYIWPVAVGEVEQPYSIETLLYDVTMQDWRTHDGIDLAAELGSAVRAVSDGKVTAVREDARYGTTVEISHTNGLVSVYANLAALPTVSEGQQVSVGQIIGSVGDTALCEAGEPCHLHFAMTKDGVSTDPGDVLP